MPGVRQLMLKCQSLLLLENIKELCTGFDDKTFCPVMQTILIVDRLKQH